MFNCNSSDNIEEKTYKSGIIKDIEEGKAERVFMRIQLDELAKKINEISEKAIAIFGVEKDIAVMNSNINYIRKELEDLKEDMKFIKKTLIENKK